VSPAAQRRFGPGGAGRGQVEMEATHGSEFALPSLLSGSCIPSRSGDPAGAGWRRAGCEPPHRTSASTPAQARGPEFKTESESRRSSARSRTPESRPAPGSQRSSDRSARTSRSPRVGAREPGCRLRRKVAQRHWGGGRGFQYRNYCLTTVALAWCNLGRIPYMR
jgi:hypothetical protein